MQIALTGTAGMFSTYREKLSAALDVFASAHSVTSVSESVINPSLIVKCDLKVRSKR